MIRRNVGDRGPVPRRPPRPGRHTSAGSSISTSAASTLHGHPPLGGGVPGRAAGEGNGAFPGAGGGRQGGRGGSAAPPAGHLEPLPERGQVHAHRRARDHPALPGRGGAGDGGGPGYGHGRRPADLERIFNAYEQGKPDAGHSHGGLGLGLTISNAIVRLRGGAIAAESPGPGAGAIFRVTLPAVSLPAQAARGGGARGRPVARCPPRPLSNPCHRRGPRGLRRSLACLPRARGTSGSRGGHRERGAQLAATVEFDLLLLDLGLPDGSGIDLLEAISRALPRDPGDRPERLRDGGGPEALPGCGVLRAPHEARRPGAPAGGDRPGGRGEPARNRRGAHEPA